MDAEYGPGNEGLDFSVTWILDVLLYVSMSKWMWIMSKGMVVSVTWTVDVLFHTFLCCSGWSACPRECEGTCV